jgi:hypothetical protein
LNSEHRRQMVSSRNARTPCLSDRLDPYRTIASLTPTRTHAHLPPPPPPLPPIPTRARTDAHTDTHTFIHGGTPTHPTSPCSSKHSSGSKRDSPKRYCLDMLCNYISVLTYRRHPDNPTSGLTDDPGKRPSSRRRCDKCMLPSCPLSERSTSRPFTVFRPRVQLSACQLPIVCGMCIYPYLTRPLRRHRSSDFERPASDR